MCCPSGNILQRRHYLQYNFMLHIINVTKFSYEEQSCSLCLRWYTALLPTLCLISGACGSSISKLRSQFRQPGIVFHLISKANCLTLQPQVPQIYCRRMAGAHHHCGRGEVAACGQTGFGLMCNIGLRGSTPCLSQPGAEGSDL